MTISKRPKVGTAAKRHLRRAVKFARDTEHAAQLARDKKRALSIVLSRRARMQSGNPSLEPTPSVLDILSSEEENQCFLDSALADKNVNDMDVYTALMRGNLAESNPEQQNREAVIAKEMSELDSW